jgi:hypothetical protein
MKLFKNPKVFKFTSTQAFVFVLCLIASSLYLGVSIAAANFANFIPLSEDLFCLYKSRFSTMMFLSFLNLAVSLGFLIEYLIHTKTIS